MLQYLFNILDRTGSSSEEQISELLADLDQNNDGVVTMDDFISSFPRLNRLLITGTNTPMRSVVAEFL